MTNIVYYSEIVYHIQLSERKVFFKGEGKHVQQWNPIHLAGWITSVRHNSPLNKLLVPFCLSWRVLQPPDLDFEGQQQHIFVTIFVWVSISNYSLPVLTSAGLQQHLLYFLLLLILAVRIGKYNYHSFECLRRKEEE